MGRRSAARKRRALSPLDEKGERRLGGGLFDAGDSPAQEPAVRSGPRNSGNGQVEPSGHVLELVGAEDPAERPPGSGIGDPASDRALRSLGLVDDRDQLQIGVPERHDPVRRAEALMTATFDRSQAVACLELARGCFEAGDRDQDVIELQGSDSG
jgi:hypothetical protein